MKIKQLNLTLGALCLALVIAGCGKSSDNSGGSAGGSTPAGKKLRLAFVSNNAATFWTIARSGCQEIGRAHV